MTSAEHLDAMDTRPDVRPVTTGPAVQPVRRAPLALALTGLVLAFGLALSGAVSVVRDGGEDGAGIRTEAGPRPTTMVLGEVFTTTVAPDTSAITAPPATGPGPGPSHPSVTASGAARATTVAPAPATTTPPTTAASPATTAVPRAAVQAPPATTAPACRNSTDPACGAFRFDPQPGPDNPMTVEVTADPASPAAGQPMIFRVTLRDPDGVSYGSSRFFFGDSGIGDSTLGECKRYGPWDPPARDAAQATVVQEVGHTYAQPGSYTATFAYEAGPYHCVDSVTGRGDRPYASSAVGTVTVVVTP